MDSPPIQPAPFAEGSPMRRIEIRPRQSDAKAEAHEATGGSLPFSCPACLQTLSTPREKTAVTVSCPQCHAEVMPPQIVSHAEARTAKSHLPPPKKTGSHTLLK